MNREEMKAKFENNIEYLKRNVPPDDIYPFAEQTFMAAMFFIHKWGDWVDLKEECDRCPVVNKWIRNIFGLHICREQGVDIELDLNLESIETDENNP